MKTTILSLFFSVAILATLTAQPADFNYQTVVRTSEGQLITEQDIAMRMSIREGSMSGPVVYQETHNVQTTAHGLVSLRVGSGMGSDNIAEVDWTSGSHYLQVEMDPDGGSAWIDMGTSQLLSVPYARHAETATNVDDADADPTNELQNLSLSGNTLSISQGNSVELPSGSEVPSEVMAKAFVNFPIVGQPNLNIDAYNVQSTGVVNTGVRTVQLVGGLFSPAVTASAVCQIRNDLSPGFCTVVGTSSSLTVRTYDSSGNPANREFSLIVFGR